MLGTQQMTLAEVVFPRADSGNRLLVFAREAALLVGFAAFVAVFAQIQVRLPWTPVPVTGQTFAVLVAGGALGWKRGLGALVLYIIVGMLGAPVFTPPNTATAGAWDLHFILPWMGNDGVLWEITSGGYIVGFALAAGLVGFLAQRGWDRGQWVHLSMLLASVLIYVPGVLWLAYLIGSDWVAPGGSKPLSELIAGDTTLQKALAAGLYPFIVGDLMKLLAASMVLPGAWLVVEKLKGRR